MTEDGGARATVDHVLAIVGSDAPVRRRSRSLPIVQDNARVQVKLAGGGSVELDSHVPATRADCRDAPRPCGHVRCRYHLWREDSSDRPGPRWRGPLGTTLRAAWLQTPTPPSCALDVAEQVTSGELLEYEDVGKALGKTGEWTRRIVRRALKALANRDASTVLVGSRRDDE